MIDPLSEVIALLRPAPCSPRGSAAPAAGACGTRRSASRASAGAGRPLSPVPSTAGAVTLEAGDFVLLPATPAFTLSGFEPVDAQADRSEGGCGADRGGASRPAEGPPTCACSAATSSSTRPTRRCWCRCCRRWYTCAASRGCRCWCAWSARRRASAAGSGPRAGAPRRGAADRGAAGDPGRRRAARTAARAGRCAHRVAIRQMHGDPERPWTVVELAKGRGCRARPSSTASRAPSACGRWSICSPGAWRWQRSAAAPRAGARGGRRRVGYGSASTFSTAFSRHVGQPPGRYARASSRGSGRAASRSGGAAARAR